MFHLDNAGSQVNSRWTVSSALSLVGYFQKGIFPGEPPISVLVIPRAVYFFNWHITHWVWITAQGGGWCHNKTPGTLGITSWHFRTRHSGTGRDLGLIPSFDVRVGKPLNTLLPFFFFFSLLFHCWNNGNSMQEYPGRLISLISWDNQCPEMLSWVSAEEEETAPLTHFAAIFHRAHERDNLTPRMAAGRWGISPRNLLTLTSSELGSCQTKSALWSNCRGILPGQTCQVVLSINVERINNSKSTRQDSQGSWFFFFPLISGRKGSLSVCG